MSCGMLLLYLTALLGIFCAVIAAGHDAEELRTVAKFSGREIDIKAISSAIPGSALPTFVHAHDLLAALADKRCEFTVHENVKREDLPHPDGLSYEELSSQSVHTTKSDYIILEHAEFINLDDAHHVASLSDEHIEHCSDQEYTAHHPVMRTLASTEPGRAVYVIGTSDGAWHKAAHLSAWIASKTPQVSKGPCLYVLREVTAATRGSSDRCLVLQTKPVHHLELFSSVKIRSEGTRPYSTTYGLKDDMEAKLKKDGEEKKKKSRAAQATQQAGLRGGRELATSWSTVDTEFGFVECKYASQTSSDPYFPGPWYIHSSTSSDVQYMLGAYLGCIQYTKSFASMNFNYDADNKMAITDPLTISGVSGVSCKNCFLYLGAGFMIYFEYTTGYYNSLPSIGCEAKMGGSAGFNVSVNIDNPAYSGSTSKVILAADTSYKTLTLGSGFYLKYKSGGLYAQVSGSGSATGSAAFGAGASAEATIGAAYSTGSGSKSGFQFISSGTFSYTAPYFTTTGFTLNNMALDVALTAVENFELSYSGYIGVKFNGQLSGNLNFASSGTNAVTISIKNFRRQRRALQSGLVEYLPGEAIPLSLTYSSFPSSQTVVVFVSVVDGTSSASYNSRQFEFTTSESGDGEFAFDWVVPWNRLYANKPLSFEARTSNRMADPVLSETFTATMFTETDGIFRKPAINSVVPLDTPFLVEWQPELLHYFKTKRGALFHGQEENAVNVTLSIARDILAANGTLLRTLQYPLATKANTGAATLVLPSTGNFTKPVAHTAPFGAVSRYFLTIQADEFSNIQSWSSGYIALSSGAGRELGGGGGEAKDAVRGLAKPSLRQRALLGLAEGTAEGSPGGSTTTTRRALASCSGSNSGSLTSSTYTGGGITGITTILGNYPTTTPTTAVQLGSPSVSCMSVTAPPPPPTPKPNALPTPLPVASPTKAPVANVPTDPPRSSPTPFPVASAPSPAPTTAVPTPAPTTATLLKLQLTITGVSLSNLGDSDKSIIRQYLADALGVMPSAISSFMVTDASTALARGAATTARALGSSAASAPAPASTSVTASGPDLADPIQHSRRLGAAVTVVAVVSVPSAGIVSNQANVANLLVQSLANSGSVALLSASGGSLLVTDISPTAVPTLPPVVSSGRSDSSASAVAIGAGVGAGVSGALLLALAGLWYYRHVEAQKSKGEEEGKEEKGEKGLEGQEANDSWRDVDPSTPSSASNPPSASAPPCIELTGLAGTHLALSESAGPAVEASADSLQSAVVVVKSGASSQVVLKRA